MRNKNIPPSTITAPNTQPTTPTTSTTTLNLTAALVNNPQNEQRDKDEWQTLANGVVKPGRRRNKARSGAQGRRQHHSDLVIRKVGGYASDVEAIYAPADAELCVTVDDSKHNYTRNVGGSTPGQNYIGGRGI